MGYNKITIDNVDGYYYFSPDGVIVSYHLIDGKEITLKGNEEIIVIEADYIPNIK